MVAGARGITAGLLLALALAGCDRAPAPLAPEDASPSASQEATVTPSASPTTGEPAEPAGAPPWVAPPLAQDDVPAILVQEWHRASAEAEPRMCPALAPDGLDGLAEASPRKANFGSGAWAVAWDWPGHPGRHGSGEYCENCGRGTFGVAGQPVNPEFTGDLTGTWPDRRRWDDGSAMGWGLEGGGGPGWLAYVTVANAHCSYNVWSTESEEHLLALIGSLRFVEGLGAPSSG